MKERIALVETRRILLRVNDQAFIEAEVWHWLNARGVAVLSASTTAHALALMKKVAVDVVVSDLVRVEGDVNNTQAGLQLARKLREIPSPVPLCIFTNHKGANIHALAKEAGASHVTESTADLLRWLDQVGL